MDKPRPELHRSIAAHDLPLSGRPFAIVATADERVALAKRLAIVAVERLSAEGVVCPEAAGRRLRVDGRLSARVIQTCVITLEPVAAEINTAFERLYGFDLGDEWPADAAGESGGAEFYLDLAGDLPVEPMAGDLLDLGDMVAEELALQLDPYPRTPGAAFGEMPEETAGTAGRDGQAGEERGLAALARWKAPGGTG